MDVLDSPSAIKILIIRLSSMGDIVLTTPVIRAVKSQVPGVEVHFLTNHSYEQVLACNPHIDKLHLYNKQEPRGVIEDLKAEKFDFIVDLQKNRRSRKIRRALRVPFSTFPKENFKKWICVYLHINFLPDKHLVDRYFESVVGLDVHNDRLGLELYIPEEEEYDEDDFPMVFEDGFVAVVLAGQHATKRIPASKVIEIGSMLHKPIMLLGGEDVYEVGEEIVSKLGDRAYNGCGKFSLYHSCSILKQADGVITGDTGLMHIAAAFNKPTAVLWGNTIPEFGMYPYMPNNRYNFRNFEVCTLKCRPCSKLGFAKCPRKDFKCMDNIYSVEVADWINKF